MAHETRREALALKRSLLEKGQRYGFYQAYRLLRLIAREEGHDDAELRIRPQLSLNFQETDIHRITARSEGGYDLTVNFLGLYGVSSPLPTFYTENLLDEALEERHGQRDFLDIINQTIYPLFFRAWLKTKPQIRLVEFGDDRLLDILYAFVGILQLEKYRHQPGIETLLQFAGIFAQFPRSAIGLKTIISGTYRSANVEVVQMDLRTEQIPEDQCCSIGMQANVLGEDSHLGSQIRTRANNCTIRMHDLDEHLFQNLLPGNVEYKRLQFIVRYFLVNPWVVTLELGLRAGISRGMRLGRNSWTELGNNTWLAANDTEFQPHVRVSL
jgi:type VI secretion system protein ImpH